MAPVSDLPKVANQGRSRAQFIKHYTNWSMLSGLFQISSLGEKLEMSIGGFEVWRQTGKESRDYRMLEERVPGSDGAYLTQLCYLAVLGRQSFSIFPTPCLGPLASSSSHILLHLLGYCLPLSFSFWVIRLFWRCLDEPGPSGSLQIIQVSGEDRSKQASPHPPVLDLSPSFIIYN